ncbi:MAG: 8-amino-7-ketopelargonate synthase [Verrucomicrobiales bacterium]|nr:8-amino-7-ketopelargonate synthase [Verrucomicrobiales bacterium]
MGLSEFNQQLSTELDAIRQKNLLRFLRRIDSPQGPKIEMNGRSLLNFSSNDYLGLANHPHLVEASLKAIRDYGCGSGAARLVSGSLKVHHDLEEAIASFKQMPAALSFSTGYAAALGTIGAICDKDDIIVIDKLVHASVVDAARLCGAKLRIFKHNDLNDLEDILKWSLAARNNEGKSSRVLVVTESVFSMDGDFAPLREIVELKDKYGAVLMVDEAHATGIYGTLGRGCIDQHGVRERVEIQMGTLGKALGASGGFICGSRELIDLLINHARSFVFSTASVPAASAAAIAALQWVQTEEGEKGRSRLFENIHQFNELVKRETGNEASVRNCPILPVIIGDEARAIVVAERLLNWGYLVPAIRYPTVARGKARLRVTMSAAHSTEQVVDFSLEIRRALRG